MIESVITLLQSTMGLAMRRPLAVVKYAQSAYLTARVQLEQKRLSVTHWVVVVINKTRPEIGLGIVGEV